MSTDVLSFRQAHGDIEHLRGLGINPNEFAKQAFERALRRAKFEHAVAEFRRNPMKRTDKRPAEVIVREMRDTRGAR